MDLPESILNALNGVLQRDKEQFAALHEPCFIGNEGQYVLDCVESTWVSSVGKYVDRFEEQLAEFTGVKRAVVVVNDLGSSVAGEGAGKKLTQAQTLGIEVMDEAAFLKMLEQ